MHEIECILHEYLSFNWDRVEEILDANSVYLSEDGLKCPWYSNRDLPVGSRPLFITILSKFPEVWLHVGFSCGLTCPQAVC